MSCCYFWENNDFKVGLRPVLHQVDEEIVGFKGLWKNVLRAVEGRGTLSETISITNVEILITQVLPSFFLQTQKYQKE